MSWKDTANAALLRTTGYRLTRETAEERREAVAEASRAAADRARARTARRFRRLAAEREARREAGREDAARRREEARLEARATGRDLPFFYDEATRRTIVRVRPRTVTNHVKLHALIQAVRYVERCEIPGEMVECGVWRGGSMQAMALTLLDLGTTQRELHLFDTFEGMSEPTEIDTRISNGDRADELLATNDRDAPIWAYADLEDVQVGMKESGYPVEKVFFHRGMVEKTLPDQAPAQIALLRLDTDWYESTRHELEHLYDRLSPGGIVIFDDYDSWAGAQKAVDDWMEGPGRDLYLAPIGPGRIAVKPFRS